MDTSEAKALIERMKGSRPTCLLCSYHPFVAKLTDPDWVPEGYEAAVDHAGYVKRCDVCNAHRLFPWADRLDAERVAEWVNVNHPRDCFCLDELRVLL